MSMSHPYPWTCQRPLTASLATCYWGNCEHTDSQTKHVLLSVVTSVTGNSELSWDHATVTGLKSSRVYHKALFWALFFSISLLMISFTFWICPLSTTVLTKTTCLMLTQTLTLSFAYCNRTPMPSYDGPESTR